MFISEKTKLFVKKIKLFVKKIKLYAEKIKLYVEKLKLYAEKLKLYVKIKTLIFRGIMHLQLRNKYYKITIEIL